MAITNSDKSLEQMLVDEHKITKEHLAAAKETQDKERAATGRPRTVGEILIDLKYLEEADYYKFVADKFDLEYLNVAHKEDIKPEFVTKLPKHIAQMYSIIVIDINGDETTIATHDPSNKFAIEDVRTFLQCDNMRVVVSPLHAINTNIALNYSMSVIAGVDDGFRPPTDDSFTFESINRSGSGNTIDDNEVVRRINSLLEYGYAKSVSDIHIEPYETETVIRMRIDGAIRPYSRINYLGGNKDPHNEMIASIKIRSGLDIAEKRLPQDGHMHIEINGKRINIRVSVIPTYYGEKAVLRYLNQNVKINDEEHFGMSVDDYHRAQKMLDVPNGIVYITGATGSGKTSTLYMMLDYLARKDVSIATIEDPIERNIKGISQMQVNEKAGLTFGRGLRAILRQDPDVFLVGETRDEETAEISVRAAITGHVVLSSLHTNDAVSTITRLRDMKVPSYMIAVSLVGVIAQRLIRKLCKHCCGQGVKPTTYEAEALGGYNGFIYRHNQNGCPLCNAGYSGRMPVHEMMYVDEEVRRMITANTPVHDIEDYCRKAQGMIPLAEGMKKLVINGITTFDEFQRLSAK